MGIVTILLISANCIFSYKGFTNQNFFEGYKFEVDKIFIQKDYKRLVTSGFLHVGWTHLLFNMFSLYAFSSGLEFELGGLQFAIVYFASLIGGDFFSLYVHRNHGDYSAVGASGAVCGVIFASIALFPGMEVGLFLIPFSIPGWIFGIAFVLYSIYGIRSGKDNIGHEAHLGGALIGMLAALLMEPWAFLYNYPTILSILIPTIVFIYMIVTMPHILYIDNLFFKNHKQHYSIDHVYNEEKNNKQKEIDSILEKISKRGISSLSKKEKETLCKFS